MEINAEKIEEKTEQEIKEQSKNSTKYFIITIVVLLAIFLTTIIVTKQLGIKGYKSVEYNGFEFIERDDTWYFQWQDLNKQIYNIGLRYNPIEAQESYMFGELNTSFNKRENIYITFDPTLNSKEMKYVLVGTYELIQTLIGPLKSKPPIMSCIKNDTETCKNAPIINCDNTNESVIYLSYNEPAQIELKQNCIIIQGKEFELVRSVDRLLYQWLRVYQIQ